MRAGYWVRYKVKVLQEPEFGLARRKNHSPRECALCFLSTKKFWCCLCQLSSCFPLNKTVKRAFACRGAVFREFISTAIYFRIGFLACYLKLPTVSNMIRFSGEGVSSSVRYASRKQSQFFAPRQAILGRSVIEAKFTKPIFKHQEVFPWHRRNRS